MSTRIERITIEVLASFIGISAVAGGIGLVGGGLPLPLEWLADTPFSSYAIPGLILGGIVGGSAVVAAVLLLRGHPLGVLVSLGAGLIQVGWIIGELVLVGTPGLVALWLQVLYFAVGAALALLAADLWRRRPHQAATS
jgi:hypothetical protein